MPSTYAHYRFGTWILKNMPKPIYQKIESAKDLFYIGLHGPDILFYYNPLFSNKVNRVGYRLHDVSGKDFFNRFDYVLEKNNDDDAKELAYLYGVLCHYALDSTCHEYVGQFEAETGITHVEIEVEFDRMLMVKDGYNPLNHPLTNHIVPSSKNAECISKFYNPITPKQIEQSLNSMISYNRLLLAPKRRKRSVVYFLMAVTGNYHDMHGLIVNQHPNPKCEISNEKLYQLYGMAKETALTLISSYPSFLQNHSLEKRLMLNFAGEEKIQDEVIIMNTKMTELEKSWVLYDVGNSAFTLLITTIIPIYFNYLAQSSNISSVDYLAYWGYAASIVTLIVAFAGPVLGTIADTKDFKKNIFTISLIIGSLGCVLMGFASTWILFLFLFMVAKIGYSSSLIFYDAMLTDVTTAERMDSLSSKGYAWGYIGSCVPFIVCLLVVLNAEKLSLSMQTAMIIDFVLIVFWWVGCTLPLLKNYKQIYYVEKNNHPIRASFSRLASTFRNIKGEKKVFLFLIAFFFYIDGVYTIIDMATAYGEALGFDSNALLLALLLTQFVAFPFSILFGKLSQKFPSEQLITVCIIAYFAIAIFAMFMYLQIHFWILAVLVGMFQGGIQALSRSYFAKIIPAEKAGEFFGLMDICGKGASFVGTSLVSIISQITGNINLGVGAIAILFLFGIFFFRKTVKAS